MANVQPIRARAIHGRRPVLDRLFIDDWKSRLSKMSQPVRGILIDAIVRLQELHTGGHPCKAFSSIRFKKIVGSSWKRVSDTCKDILQQYDSSTLLAWSSWISSGGHMRDCEPRTARLLTTLCDVFSGTCDACSGACDRESLGALFLSLGTRTDALSDSAQLLLSFTRTELDLLCHGDSKTAGDVAESHSPATAGMAATRHDNPHICLSRNEQECMAVLAMALIQLDPYFASGEYKRRQVGTCRLFSSPSSEKTDGASTFMGNGINRYTEALETYCDHLLSNGHLCVGQVVLSAVDITLGKKDERGEDIHARHVSPVLLPLRVGTPCAYVSFSSWPKLRMSIASEPFPFYPAALYDDAKRSNVPRLPCLPVFALRVCREADQRILAFMKELGHSNSYVAISACKRIVTQLSSLMQSPAYDAEFKTLLCSEGRTLARDLLCNLETVEAEPVLASKCAIAQEDVGRTFPFTDTLIKRLLEAEKKSETDGDSALERGDSALERGDSALERGYECGRMSMPTVNRRDAFEAALLRISDAFGISKLTSVKEYADAMTRSAAAFFNRSRDVHPTHHLRFGRRASSVAETLSVSEPEERTALPTLTPQQTVQVLECVDKKLSNKDYFLATCDVADYLLGRLDCEEYISEIFVGFVPLDEYKHLIEQIAISTSLLAPCINIILNDYTGLVVGPPSEELGALFTISTIERL